MIIDCSTLLRMRMLQQDTSSTLATISGDVTFTFSGGEELFCDRFMLAARSPVFRAMFYGHMSEAVSSHPEVAIDDLPAQDVRALLSFIYTDKMPEGPNLLEMQGLLVAARKYCLSTLQNICSDAIVRSLTPDNACQHCAEAYARSEFELATACLKVIASSFQHVPVTEIAKLPAECLKLLVQSDETEADEVRIFSACLAWLQYRMQRGEDADSSLREVISLVRFENMSSQEFAMHVVPTGLLPAEQMLEILAAGVLGKLQHRPRGDSDHAGGDKLIVLGGYDSSGTRLADVHALDMRTGQWRQLPKLRKPLCSMGACVCRGVLYCVGGYTGSNHDASVECLDLANPTCWSPAPPM